MAFTRRALKKADWQSIFIRKLPQPILKTEILAVGAVARLVGPGTESAYWVVSQRALFSPNCRYLAPKIGRLNKSIEGY
jgi:hypothetical protein